MALAEHAAESATIATEADARAREGVDLVAAVSGDLEHAVASAMQSLELIESLGEQVERVGAIAQTINQIASRTKILALNAAIEAGRAGGARTGLRSRGRGSREARRLHHRGSVGSAERRGETIGHAARVADTLGAATVSVSGDPRARACALALESIAATLAPVLDVAREQAGRFHAVYEETTARRVGKDPARGPRRVGRLYSRRAHPLPRLPLRGRRGPGT